MFFRLFSLRLGLISPPLSSEQVIRVKINDQRLKIPMPTASRSPPRPATCVKTGVSTLYAQRHRRRDDTGILLFFNQLITLARSMH
jgi:hypothetical protein